VPPCSAPPNRGLGDEGYRHRFGTLTERTLGDAAVSRLPPQGPWPGPTAGRKVNARSLRDGGTVARAKAAPCSAGLRRVCRRRRAGHSAIPDRQPKAPRRLRNCEGFFWVEPPAYSYCSSAEYPAETNSIALFLPRVRSGGGIDFPNTADWLSAGRGRQSV